MPHPAQEDFPHAEHVTLRHMVTSSMKGALYSSKLVVNSKQLVRTPATMLNKGEELLSTAQKAI
jgi:hypothetical protein